MSFTSRAATAFMPCVSSIPTLPTIRLISASLQVVSIAGVNVRIGGGRWRVEGEIGPKLTGAARNHNAGIARTPHGMLLATDSVRVVFAVSCAGAGCNGRAEWSYDVWAIQGTLSAAR